MFAPACRKTPRRVTTVRSPTAAIRGHRRIRNLVDSGKAARIGAKWSPITQTNSCRKRAERDDPFFMYLAFNAPHDPRQSPAEYVEQVSTRCDRAFPKTSSRSIRMPRRSVAARSFVTNDLHHFPEHPMPCKVHRQEYYAIITHMDDDGRSHS